MEIFVNIPAPPLPGGALGLSIGLAAAAAGLGLLILGHLAASWRLLPAAALGWLAWGGGGYVAVKTGASALLAATGLSALGALAGLLAARLAWILVFTALLAVFIIVVLGCIYAHNDGPPPGGFEPVGTLGEWRELLGATLAERRTWMLAAHRRDLSLALAATLAFGLLIGTHKPVAARGLSICLFGAMLTTSGICYVIYAAVGSVDFTAGYRPWALTALASVLFIAGALRQWRIERGRLAEAKAALAKAKAIGTKSAAPDKPAAPGK